MPSLQSDLRTFLLAQSAVYQPILDALPVGTNPNAAVVTDRVGYVMTAQNKGGKPYFVFDGPFDYNAGLVSGGATRLKVGSFFFYCYAAYQDTCYDWITAVENALIDLFVPGYFYTGDAVRLMSMLYIQGSKRISAGDQVALVGKEHPMCCGAAAFQIGWQE